MANMIRGLSLLFVLVVGGCDRAGPEASSPVAKAVESAAEAPAESSVGIVELSDAQLCQQLTAEEATGVLGSQRSSGPHPFGGCLYESTSARPLRMFNSSHASRAEHMELIKGLQGNCKDGPDGSLLCAVGFDAQNGKISAVWFAGKGTALEIESDAGLEEPDALALLAAARN